jgi:hypothetical protein
MGLSTNNAPRPPLLLNREPSVGDIRAVMKAVYPRAAAHFRRCRRTPAHAACRRSLELDTAGGQLRDRHSRKCLFDRTVAPRQPSHRADRSGNRSGRGRQRARRCCRKQTTHQKEKLRPLRAGADCGRTSSIPPPCVWKSTLAATQERPPAGRNQTLDGKAQPFESLVTKRTSTILRLW